MQHKIGACPISDISIAIIATSVHRNDSLNAVAFMINELKDTVPIWKKVRWCCAILTVVTLFIFSSHALLIRFLVLLRLLLHSLTIGDIR
jgi:hypothetical protein